MIGVNVFYNLLQTIIGFMRRENLSKEQILRDVEFENPNILQTALDKGKRVIFITAHYNNWELLPIAVASKFNIKLVGVGRKLDSRLMDRILKDSRELYGVEMVYRKGAIKNLMRALKRGSVVGLLVDQHLGKKQGGIGVNFFNNKVLHSPSASILARALDAVIVPVFIHSTDHNRYKITFYQPIDNIKTDDKTKDILEMTQAQANITQSIIKKDPNWWFWVHKRWKGFYPDIYNL